MAELTLDQALQQGIEAHKAGQVQEADRLYTAMLKARPKHPDANHNMGVLAVGVGKVQEALPFFKTALEANPATAQFWLSYIDALIKLGKLADAKAVLDQATSKGAKGDGFDKLEQRLNVPDQEPLETSDAASEAHQEQPNILDTLKLTQVIKLAKKKSNEGFPEEARRVYQDVLVKFPKNKRALDGIKALAGGPFGNAPKVQDPPQDQLQALVNLYSQGQLQQTIERAETLAQQFPKSVILFNIQGAALKGLGRLDLSIEAYNKALTIKPDYAVAYSNMGVTLQKQGKLEEAIEAYNKALALKPDKAEAHYNMGNALQEQGKLEKAMEAYKKALAIKPDYADAHKNIGVTLQEQGKPAEAIEAYNKALAIKPDYAAVNNNIAKLLYASKNYEKAIQLFSKDDSIKSQSYLLRCLYKLDEQAKFYKKLDYLVERGENNCVIGSFTSRAEIRYGIKKYNPFCNDPFEYVLKTDLTKECDFKKIFVENAANVLSNDEVKHKSQGLLKNGIQTAGNIFNQVGSATNLWQNIIHSELTKYKDHFCKSQEGLIRGWPTDYNIYGWLVSMKSGGELSAHIHDTGWITGSIYINVPPKSKKDSGNLVVTIDEEKGETENSTSIDVVTGSLCLFPSSLLHYTIPFEADENRIVLAFDVIPK